MQQPSFLTVFSAYQPDAELRSALEGWQVAKAVVDKTTRFIRAEVICADVPDEAVVHKVKEGLSAAYRVGADISVLSCPKTEVPPVEEELPPPPGDDQAPPVPEEEDAFKRTEAIRAEALKRVTAVHRSAPKGEKKTGKVIFGKTIK